MDDGEEDSDVTVTLPDVPEWEERERLILEKEVLGFYLSSHPLAEHEQTLSSYCSHATNEISQVRDRGEVTLGGMLSAIKHARTRKGDKYTNFDLEDMGGAIRCIVWPKQFEEFGDLVQPDAILFVRGTIDRRGGDEANLIVEELIPLDQLASRFTRGIMVRIKENGRTDDVLAKLREILRAYPGDGQVQLYLTLDEGTGVVLQSQKLRVELQTEMRSRVDELLGPGNLKLLTNGSRSNGA